MNCQVIRMFGSWDDVIYLCGSTVSKKITNKSPTQQWIRRILRAEHSPIRVISFLVRFSDIPYWVSTHLVRHKVGIEHWVRSQREDKTGVSRSSLTQDALVDHVVLVNAQALITISRKRLCKKASPETRDAWIMLVNAIEEYAPDIAHACMPDCEYRGGCPEMVTCEKFNVGGNQ